MTEMITVEQRMTAVVFAAVVAATMGKAAEIQAFVLLTNLAAAMPEHKTQRLESEANRCVGHWAIRSSVHS